MSAKINTLIDRIKAVYPHLHIRKAELDESGQNNDILIVNANIIFRFPRYPGALTWLQVEAAVLETIEERVPLPVPKPVYLNLNGSAAGEVFMGYLRLPGVPLLRDTFTAIKDHSVRVRIAEQLAGFLHSLHTTPLSQIKPTLPQVDTQAQCRDIYHRMREKLFPYMRPEAREWAEGHFESFLAEAANFDYQPVLKHGDFGATNILFDPHQLTVSGIIDFGSAALGDPAYDFAGLLSSFGEDFIVDCARTYPQVDRFTPRIYFYRGTFALLEALFGVEHNDKTAFVAGMKNYV